MPVKGYLGIYSLVAVAASVLSVLAIIITNPVTIGPVGVTLWFLLLGAAVTSWGTIAAFVVERRYRPKANRQSVLDNARRRGLFAGSFVVILLALSSLQQLTVRDAVLLLLLVGLIEFYMVARPQKGHQR